MPSASAWGRRWVGQKTRSPTIARIAGTSVMATSSPIVTVNANAGPSALKNGDCATSRVAVPTMTAVPATVTIGPDLVMAAAVVCRTRSRASSAGPLRGSASTRASRSDEQKNTT